MRREEFQRAGFNFLAAAIVLSSTLDAGLPLVIRQVLTKPQIVETTTEVEGATHVTSIE